MLKSIAKFFLNKLPNNLRNELLFKKDMLMKDKVIRKWQEAGCPAPPPHVIKQQAIKQYQSQYKYTILVETGAYLGHMLETQRQNFEKLYSIELSEKFWKYNVNKFKKYKNVEIRLGDSAQELPKLIKDINKSSIFWLDGHYSLGTAKGDKECPIYDELEAIFSSKIKQHVILIDDARDFTGRNDYPTILQLQEYVENKKIKHSFAVKDDIIRIVIE